MNYPESPEKRKARRVYELYVESVGKPPPPPVDDWQLNYRGTKEERARLRAWMGLDDDQEERGPQPDQEASLF